VTLAALATLGLCALGTDRLARRTAPVASDHHGRRGQVTSGEAGQADAGRVAPASPRPG
jgi:hypothetical protein